MKMNKMTAVLTAAALTLSLLCGCGGGDQTQTTLSSDNEEKTYTVTVVDQDGNPVANAIMQWTDAAGGTQLAITGADGIVTATGETAMTSISVTSVPENYTASQSIYEFGSQASLTIVLTGTGSAENTNVTYTVTVVDQDGNPVSGVIVQICDEENCKLPMTTDENGTASAEYAQSEYHVTLNTLPDGYSSEETDFYFNGATELTIVVTAEDVE